MHIINYIHNVRLYSQMIRGKQPEKTAKVRINGIWILHPKEEVFLKLGANLFSVLSIDHVP